MTERILQHLQIQQSAPTLIYLQEIITAYCQTVPWESVSRIVKKNSGCAPADCLRLEDEFWLAALEMGTGGTCYESNWALFKLLQSLGFDGYLTINKVADKSSFHSAIVVMIEGEKYMADVGYPLYAPVKMDEKASCFTEASFITYQSKPVGQNEYIIENMPHPKPYLFHLKDVPVSEADYLKVAVDDYGDNGLFLDRLVIRKVVNGVPTRFDSEDLPYNIHLLQHGAKHRNYVAPAAVVEALQMHFGVDKSLLFKAFTVLSNITETANSTKTALYSPLVAPNP